MSTTKGLSFGRAVRSEWIKFTTLRSTWITYGVALLIADGLAMAITAGHGSELHSRGMAILPDAASFPLRGIIFAQLAIGVVGVLFVTGEYATGMIRASMTAAPRRTPVLLSKALVFAVFTSVIAAAMMFAAFFAGQAVLGQWHYDVALSSPGALRAVLAATYYLVCVGLIGLGLGWAIRNTGGAIAALFTIVFVLPLVVQALPQDWIDRINKYLPLSLSDRLLTTDGSIDHAVSLPWAFGLLAIYVAVALVGGWIVLKRRDV